MREWPDHDQSDDLGQEDTCVAQVFHMKPAILARIQDYISPRFSLLFLILAILCAPVIASIWILELFDELSARLLMTVVVGIVPAFEFQPLPKTWQARGDLFLLICFVVLMLLIAAGVKFDWAGLALNSIMLLVTAMYGWLVWKLMRRDWLLLAGLMLVLGLTMIYWTAALVVSEESLNILLLPLPVVALVSIAWTPLAWWVLDMARQWKNHKVKGPGTQTLAMVILFLPAIVVAIAVPGMLELSQAWSAVSLALIGVLLSAVVANPLRKFLLEWGKLMPDVGASSKE